MANLIRPQQPTTHHLGARDTKVLTPHAPKQRHTGSNSLPSAHLCRLPCALPRAVHHSLPFFKLGTACRRGCRCRCILLLLLPLFLLPVDCCCCCCCVFAHAHVRLAAVCEACRHGFTLHEASRWQQALGQSQTRCAGQAATAGNHLPKTVCRTAPALSSVAVG